MNTIREYNRTKEEESRIMTIWLTVTIKAHPFIDKVYWMRQFDIVKKEYLPSAKTYVYVENDQILGFISIIGGDTVGALFVDVKHQGRGIGGSLMRHVQGVSSDLKLSVYTRNKRAVAFYKKAGFAAEREQTDFSTGQQEYVMRWRRG